MTTDELRKYDVRTYLKEVKNGYYKFYLSFLIAENIVECLLCEAKNWLKEWDEEHEEEEKEQVKQFDINKWVKNKIENNEEDDSEKFDSFREYFEQDINDNFYTCLDKWVMFRKDCLEIVYALSYYDWEDNELGIEPKNIEQIAALALCEYRDNNYSEIEELAARILYSYGHELLNKQAA